MKSSASVRSSERAMVYRREVSGVMTVRPALEWSCESRLVVDFIFRDASKRARGLLYIAPRLIHSRKRGRVEKS